MKIIGLTYDGARTELAVKGDSALLVNEKPFFLPDTVSRIMAQPCLVLRVSKLGKNIAERFASRYYDACTVGTDLWADQVHAGTILSGVQPAIAHSLDGSFPIGNLISTEGMYNLRWEISDPVGTPLRSSTLAQEDLICTPEQAISLISRYMTIRQGDFIYIDMHAQPTLLSPEQRIHGYKDSQQLLFCKIK